MTASRVESTGNEGLDVVLVGGLPADRLYLLEGAPGSGKTTLALQFLLEGVRRGERALYITLSETREELSVVAASHGWALEAFDVFEFNSAENAAVRGEFLGVGMGMITKPFALEALAAKIEGMIG